MSADEQVLKALAKLEVKFETLDSRLDSIEKILVKQEANIEHHVKRTDLAEARMEKMEELGANRLDKLETRVQPLEKFKAYSEGTLKGVGVLATLVGVVAGIVKIISFFQ